MLDRMKSEHADDRSGRGHVLDILEKLIRHSELSLDAICATATLEM